MNEFVIVFSKVVLRLGKTTTLYTITDVAVVFFLNRRMEQEIGSNLPAGRQVTFRNC